MTSPPEPSVQPIDVTYRDSEPAKLEVNTRRWESEYSYGQTYTFKMEGSTAVLTAVEGDGDAYNVPGNAGTREVAHDAVADLPFVQGVVMFTEA